MDDAWTGATTDVTDKVQMDVILLVFCAGKLRCVSPQFYHGILTDFQLTLTM